MELSDFVRPRYLILILMVSVTSALAAPVPFKSKEEIQFTAKGEVPFMDFLQVSEFKGIIERPFEKNPDLKQADVFEFKAGDKIKMDRSLCESMVAKIFGPPAKNPLQVKDVVIYKTPTGDACDAQIIDVNDPSSKAPERRLISGFLNLKPYAVVFQLSKKSDAEVQENIRDFWIGLRGK